MENPGRRVGQRVARALFCAALLLGGAFAGSALTLLGLAAGGPVAEAVVLDSAGGHALATGGVETCPMCALAPGLAVAEGQTPAPRAVEQAGPFLQELAAVKVDGRWGFIDKTGRMVIPPRFEETYGFGGLAPVKVDGRWGFIERTGNMVIPPQFDEVKGFAGGLAPVKVGDRWGYIDRTGRMVIAPQFQSADTHYNGLTSARLDDRWVYIDATGRVVIDLEARLGNGS